MIFGEPLEIDRRNNKDHALKCVFFGFGSPSGYNSGNQHLQWLRLKELYQWCWINHPWFLLVLVLSWMYSPKEFIWFWTTIINPVLQPNSSEDSKLTVRMFLSNFLGHILTLRHSEQNDRQSRRHSGQSGRQVGDQVGDKMGDKVGDRVGDKVRDKAENIVGNGVGDKMGNKVDNIVGGKLGDEVGDILGDNGETSGRQ